MPACWLCDWDCHGVVIVGMARCFTAVLSQSSPCLTGDAEDIWDEVKEQNGVSFMRGVKCHNDIEDAPNTIRVATKTDAPVRGRTGCFGGARL